MENKQQIKIHTEGTPNPNALKFVLDKTLLERGTANFPNKEKAKDSSLAVKLFEVKSVSEVLIGKNFITVTKDPNTIWENIYEDILLAIDKFFLSGEPILLKIESQEGKGKSDVEQRILDILNDQIRPAVASDGGDIIFDSYKDGVLRLHLQGACSSCPSSIMTLKAGIETMLKREIPELKEVISV